MAELRDTRQEAATVESRRAMRRRLLSLAGGGGAIAAGAALASDLGAVAGAAQNTSGLDGAWEAAFLLYTSPPGAPANRILHIFTSGGGVIAQIGPVGRRPDGSVANLSIGIGSWARTGGRGFEYSYHYTRWLDEATRIEQNVVWARLTLDASGNRWTGDWKVREVDAAGLVVGTREGPVEGNRLGVDSLA